MAPTSTVDVAVRSVTDEEVDFYFDNGWVKVPNLISAESAAALLEGAKRALGDDGTTGLDLSADDGVRSWFRVHLEMRKADANYMALATSPQLGRNAARLFGRDSSVRLMQESLMVKLPVGTGKGQPTDFHQDTAQHMFFEGNSMNVWVALDEVTPEMGSMQFYSRSHKLGNLGNLFVPEVREGWEAELSRRCELTEPVHFLPGDATFHTNFTIHGTGANMGDRPRWAWGGMLLPADCRYTGAKSYYTDGLGLTPFGPLDHENFPVIYTPAG